jgi:hypothetical protein
MGTMIGVALVAIVGCVVVARALAARRRAARAQALREDVPVDLPAPVAMVWIPTARKRSASSSPDGHDAYGALAPGSLEDRSRRH